MLEVERKKVQVNDIIFFYDNLLFGPAISKDCKLLFTTSVDSESNRRFCEDNILIFLM